MEEQKKYNSTEERLEAFLLAHGASFAGFCEISPLPELPALRYAVSFGVKLSDAVLATIADEPTQMYFQHYRTANALLDAIAFSLCGELEREGHAAFPVAASQSLGGERRYAGVIPHKTCAVLAGLGFVGKSGLFLHREYGSKVRLCTVLTDLPLSPLLPRMENGCGECTACRDACPAGAIYGELPHTDGTRNFDAEKCSRYMKEHFQEIGRGSVCGVCIRVCPGNRLR